MIDTETEPPPSAPQIDGPHSRACGMTPHPHGLSCSPDCPTCAARPGTFGQVVVAATSPNHSEMGRFDG